MIAKTILRLTTFLILPPPSLYHICLLLAHLTVICGLVFLPSTLDHANNIEPLAATERRIAPINLTRNRVHRPDALSSLRKRGYDLHILNDGWRMRFLRIESGLPIALASSLLEDFYERVINRLHEYIVMFPPLRIVSLNVLDLYLEFRCDSAELSWRFIHGFVAAMLDATRKGFTGGFEAIVFHESKDAVVSVALRGLGSGEQSGST